MTHGDLRAILEAGDVEACLAYFEHAGEDERRAVAAQVLEWYATQDAARLNRWEPNPLMPAAEVAVRAACSLSEIKKRGLDLTLRDAGVRVLEARRPAWLTEYAGWSLERMPFIWPSVRRLERAGLCGRPETDHYILGMIEGLADRRGNPNVREALQNDPELLEREVWKLFEIEGGGEFSLAARDKYLRPEASWEAGLVALSAEGRLSRDRLLNASLDALERDFAQFRAGWFSRFHEALEPTLDERAARMERYLNLLASKIPPTVSFALGALTRLDRAKRLPAEALVEQISPVLAARAKGTVSSALKLLENAAGREPSLKSRAASIAAEGLAHESPEVQELAFGLVVRIGDRRDKALLTVLRKQVDQLAASVRPQVNDWLGPAGDEGSAAPSPAEPPTGGLDALIARAEALAPRFRELAGIDAALVAIRDGHFDVPALRFDGTEFPRLDPAAAIRPIADLDELIDVFAAVLENPDATDDLERVLDGVARLCDQRPADFEAHTGPLRKRATALLERGFAGGPFLGSHPTLDLCALALSWIGRDAVDPDVAPRIEERHHNTIRRICDYQKTIGKWTGTAYLSEHSAEQLFLSRRALAVARRAASGRAEPLLGAPTHRGGWIDPTVLVDRITETHGAANAPDLLDQVQAILRLAPDRREDARRRMAKFPGEFAQAVRYALGADDTEIGPTPALWIAAARVRAPFDDDPRVLARHPDLGPDAGAAARITYAVQLEPDREGRTWARFRVRREPKELPEVRAEHATVRLHMHQGERDSASIRWGATIWPIAREAWLAQGVWVIGINLDWWEAHWSDRTYLETMTDPDLPLRPMALLLLVLGLAAKEADQHGLATDGLIAAIDDGRIDGPLLGGMLRSLLPTGLIKPSRWAKALRDAARVSPLHTRVVAHAIQHALAGELTEPPRDLLALLELLKELLIELGEPLSVAEARAWLAEWKTSGKSAKAAKELLALTDSGDPAVRREAALRALARRIERAERWARCQAGKRGSSSQTTKRRPPVSD